MSHPDRVGKYQILGKIADGGMAEVFLAVQTGAEGFQKRVALKMILPYYVRDEAFVRSFVNEARICGLLTHPNLVQVYEFAREGEQLYLAMEFIEGLDLERVITHRKLARRPLTPAVIAEIVLQMLDGLEYAHNASFGGKHLNVVHRDLKPSNVLIDRSGFVKIVDFGVAKASNNLYKTLNQGTAKGTVSYMSPEQATGKTDLGAPSDLFSVGVILYEMLTGDRLFDGDNLFAILDDVRSAPLESKINSPRIPPVFQPILARALARDLYVRYASATEMAREIRSAFPDLGGPLLLARTVEQLRTEGLEVMGLQNDGHTARRRAQETLQDSAVSAPGRAERVNLAGDLPEETAEATEWKGRESAHEASTPPRTFSSGEPTNLSINKLSSEHPPTGQPNLAEAEDTDPAQLREPRSAAHLPFDTPKPLPKPTHHAPEPSFAGRPSLHETQPLPGRAGYGPAPLPVATPGGGSPTALHAPPPPVNFPPGGAPPLSPEAFVSPPAGAFVSGGKNGSVPASLVPAAGVAEAAGPAGALTGAGVAGGAPIHRAVGGAHVAARPSIPFMKEASVWSSLPSDNWISRGDEATGWSAEALQTSAAVPLLPRQEGHHALPRPIPTSQGVQRLFDEPPRWVEAGDTNPLEEVPTTTGAIRSEVRAVPLQLLSMPAIPVNPPAVQPLSASSDSTANPVPRSAGLLKLIVGLLLVSVLVYLWVFSGPVDVTIEFSGLPGKATVAIQGDPPTQRVHDWKYTVRLEKVTAYDFTLHLPGEIPVEFRREIDPHDENTWKISLPTPANSPDLPNNP
ncbi:MAG: protein kinase domain-containing protein [Myxococcota bacterium]